MNEYAVYLRNPDGKRAAVVSGITAVTATFRLNQPSKWVISGAGLEECPLADNAEIAVFRDNKILFCGYAESKKVKYDAKTRIYEWDVSGLSDMGKLADRLIFPDPSAETPDPEAVWTDEDILSELLRTAIDGNAGASAQLPRKLQRLTLPVESPVGDDVTVESKFDELLKFIQDKLKDTEIQIKEAWDMETGSWSLIITEPEDVSGNVIFSVENGSISAWERTVSAPKANWLLVTGCKKPVDQPEPDPEAEPEPEEGEDPEPEDETLSVIVWDADSIAKWGRIEKTVGRSDISRIVEKDEEGEIIYEEPWDEVLARLEAAAYEELEKSTAQFGYKLTTTEINRNVYGEDYDIGSVVSVRIGEDEFTAKVEEIKISYKAGVETITPSVGTMQRGELQTVFDDLGALKEQIKVLQKSL